MCVSIQTDQKVLSASEQNLIAVIFPGRKLAVILKQKRNAKTHQLSNKQDQVNTALSQKSERGNYQPPKCIRSDRVAGVDDQNILHRTGTCSAVIGVQKGGLRRLLRIY